VASLHSFLDDRALELGEDTRHAALKLRKLVLRFLPMLRELGIAHLRVAG